MKKIGLLINGYKGFSVLEKITKEEKEYEISFVSLGKFGSLGRKHENNENISGVKIIHKEDLSDEIFASVDFVFCIGWTFLIKDPPENMIVLHDSLLPQYRGFCPTVNAMINGEYEYGITAFAPVEEVDAGPIYLQKKYRIGILEKIKDVYGKLIPLYVEMIEEIIKSDSLSPVEQAGFPTYCIWRDHDDYYINWSWSSGKIVNFVNAVGYPYDGARTTYLGREIIIDDVRIIEDKYFQERHPGKIFLIKDNKPEVICGDGDGNPCKRDGMIIIVSARDASTLKSVVFNKLRQRFLGKKMV